MEVKRIGQARDQRLCVSECVSLCALKEGRVAGEGESISLRIHSHPLTAHCNKCILTEGKEGRVKEEESERKRTGERRMRRPSKPKAAHFGTVQEDKGTIGRKRQKKVERRKVKDEQEEKMLQVKKQLGKLSRSINSFAPFSLH